MIPFKVYNPLLPHVALPNASEVNTAFGVNVPPVTLNVFVTSDVVVKVPVLSDVDEIFPVDVNDVAVINPAAKPPLPSLLTIVLAVLEEVAESTFDATVVIVDDNTPPTLFTVGASADPPKSLVNFKIPFTLDVASGAPEPPINVATKAVVAICVELVPGAAVTAVGVPVNAGDVDNTTDPVPVELLVPVPPLATLNGVVKLNVPDEIAVAVIVPTARLVDQVAFPSASEAVITEPIV